MEGGEDGSDRSDKSDVSEVWDVVFWESGGYANRVSLQFRWYVYVNQDGSVGGEGGEVAEVAQGFGKEDCYGQNQA